MDWVSIVTTVVGAGFFTAIVQAAITNIGERRSHRRKASYVALRIAVGLEGFADHCFDRFSDVDLHETSEGRAGKLWTELPPVPPYPNDDEGWRVVDLQLAEKALTFIGRVRLSNGLVAFTLETNSPEDAADMCLHECAEMGLEALNLAASFRKKYDFPEFKAIGREHFEAYLRDKAKGKL